MTYKKDLTERDIVTKFIIPNLVKAGWDIHKQVREEVYFTDGRVYVKGKNTKRGKAKKADIILYHKPNIPVAVIEAKDNNHSIGAGMQQGLGYAEILDIPVAYSSNGDGFLEHDRTNFSGKIERELSLDKNTKASKHRSKNGFHLMIIFLMVQDENRATINKLR
jgi:type I restriction enzyme R subunit